MCLQGASRVAAVLQDFPPDVLRTLIVWVPMLPPDSAEAAETAARNFPDAAHFWDGDRALASRLGQALSITSAESIGAPGGQGFAWDVYLAYGRGKAIDELPIFWMHQLAVTHAPRLDPNEFRRRVRRLLRAPTG
jgi:hypothetical protein